MNQLQMRHATELEKKNEQTQNPKVFRFLGISQRLHHFFNWT